MRLVGQSFDEQILGIGLGRGEAPGDMAVMADHHQGHAGRGAPDQDAARQFDTREIPGGGQSDCRCGRWPAGACRSLLNVPALTQLLEAPGIGIQRGSSSEERRWARRARSVADRPR